MPIPKDNILELLQSRGDHARATEAENEPPDQADPGTDLLAKRVHGPHHLIRA